MDSNRVLYIKERDNMIKTIEEMLIDHLPNRYEDTLACYSCFKHESWEDIDEDTGELLGFISYFFLDFKHDMIITAAKDNKFSKAQWRILRDTLRARAKPIRIQSDPKNQALHKGAARLGGKFFGEEIFFDEPYSKA